MKMNQVIQKTTNAKAMTAAIMAGDDARQPLKFRLFLSFVGTLMAIMLSTAEVLADAKDDPFLTKVIIDQLEKRDGDQENPLVFSGQLWAGYDLNKIWLKSEYEESAGETEENELQLLYGKAIAPFWDIQAGLRKDFSLDNQPGRNWAVIGVQGLAPYYFEVDTALFIGESGRSAFRFEAEYELLFTQKLILTPEIEANFYGQSDELTRTGSGLSDVELGLRLRYEVRREFAPYIGVNWTKLYGRSADYARLEGGVASDTEFVIGLRAWF